MINWGKLLTILIVFSFFSCNTEKPKVHTMQMLESPTQGYSMQPFLFSNDKDIFMSWTQKVNDSVHTLNYSTLSGGKWTDPIEIEQGNDWFVNWADFPAIAENKKNILTHFLQKSDSATFAYDVQIKQSSNNGVSWNEKQKLHGDSTNTEHGFVTMLPYKENSFFITWLDGRNTGGGGHGDGHNVGGAMNIRTAIVLANGEIVDDVLVDAKTCDCCQTSAAITPNGPIIVYRDRTDQEVRDIYISRFVDEKWTVPKSIHDDNWEINGCPVNGPKADSYNNTLAISWFTAANNIPKVNLVFSKNNGESFNVPIQIDSGKPIGRVDLALIDEQNAIVSWLESTDEEAEIKMMRVNIDGSKSNPIVISTISASRASGFPQFELLHENVIVAWNNVSENGVTVKIASLPIEILD